MSAAGSRKNLSDQRGPLAPLAIEPVARESRCGLSRGGECCGVCRRQSRRVYNADWPFPSLAADRRAYPLIGFAP